MAGPGDCITGTTSNRAVITVEAMATGIINHAYIANISNDIN